MARARKNDVQAIIAAANAVGDEPVIPLFPNAGEDPEAPARIGITRVVPNDGFLLSTQELNITEDWLKENFGGGAYELALFDQNGRPIGQPRRIKIAGPPVSRPELEGRANALKDEEARAESAMTLQTRLFREQIEMLKQEAQAQRDRAKMELEISIRGRQAEADEREERERRRHERDMERERERAERERVREKEAQASAGAQQQQFMLAIQALNKEQTNMMITMMQASTSKQDPLEAAVRINSMVESRLELQQGDPSERNAQQMWGLVGKGLDAIAGQKGEASTPTPNAPQPAQAKTVQPAGRTPAQAQQASAGDLPVPVVVKQRLQSLMKKVQDSGYDFLEVLKGLEEGDLAIVPTDEYQDGQDALKQLGDADDDEPDETPRKKAPAMDNPRRKDRRPADAPAVVDGSKGDGAPETASTPGRTDGGQGDSSPGPTSPHGSGPAVQPAEAQVS